jgi:hypothetical protein
MIALNKCNARLPEKLFCGSLDRLQICQVELQQIRFLSSAVLELADGGLTFSLITACNVYLGIFCEEDLRIARSA